MKRKLRTTTAAVVSVIALMALAPWGVARGQTRQPPPPATPFDGVPAFGESAPAIGSLSIPAVGNAFLNGGGRLAALQNPDGGWGWDLIGPSALNTIGPIGMGLGKAYEHTGNSGQLATLAKTGALLLTKDGNFSPSDGYLAAELDGIFGGTTYRDYVNAHFYGPLAAGTYHRLGCVDCPDSTAYDTAAFVAKIRTNRTSWGQGNLAAWDVGMGLVGASMSGVTGADLNAWIAGTEASINALDGTQYYDVIGLAGGLYGLAFVGQEFDPTSGLASVATNLESMGTILVGYQLGTGGFTWNSQQLAEGAGNESIQETAYSILALSKTNRTTFLPAILRAADYLFSTQLGTGGWEGYVGDPYGENNEVTGEALWGLDTGYPVGDVWVCPTGDCGHPDASYNTVQDGVDNVRVGGTVHILAGTYEEQVHIARSVTLIGADPATVIIQSPDSLSACWGSKNPIVCVENTDANIMDLTVDGAGKGEANYQFVGVGYHNASGTVSGNTIIGIRNDPLDGMQSGAAFYALNEDASPRTITVTGNDIRDYQKGGIVLNGDNLTGDAENNTVTGAGPTSLIAMNGIQIGFGAGGFVKDNTIAGNVWTGMYPTAINNDPFTDPNSDGAAGVLLYATGAGVEVSGNTLTGNQFGVASVGAPSLNVHNNAITGLAHTGHAYPVGIAIWSGDGSATDVATSATLANNTIDTHDYGLLILDHTAGAPSPSATATGNTFTHNHIQVASTDGTIDIPTTLSSNTFDLAVTVSGSPYLPFIWSHIQDGVNAASSGDIVHVNPGTYPERVTLDKPLTLSGAGVGLSTIDATTFGTAGNVIDITTLTGDTKIQGFDILTGDNSNGIHFAGGTDAAGKIDILDNHILATNSHDDQYGIIGGYMDVRTLTITGNEISNTYSNSILAELQMGATEISGNTFNGAFPSIWFMTYDGHNVATLQKVSGNTFDMSTAEAGSGVSGVGVNPSTSYVDASRRTGKYASFVITGNTFTGLNDVSFKGISVGESSSDGTSGGVTNLTISGNTISGTDGKGIQLYGHITGADIQGNVVTGLFQGIKAFTYLTTFYPQNNHIACNQITGASDKLVYWDGTGTFNVEQNWWGSDLGPSPAAMSTNVDYTPWLLTPTCPAVDVHVAGVLKGTYVISPGWGDRESYASLNNGPVLVDTSSGASILASERFIYADGTGSDHLTGSPTSYSELMGFPSNQLTTDYWFPWYNNHNMWSQLRFGNPSTTQSTTVSVYIGTTLLGSYPLGPTESLRVDYPGVNGGPLHIMSSGGVPIIGSERVIYSDLNGTVQNGNHTSYYELMGIPGNQLTTEYWIPWYNNVNMWTQLRFANPDASQSTTISVYMGASLLGSYDLGPGTSTRVDFPGVNGGPIRIVSSGGVNIIAAERVIYSVGGVQNGTHTSYSELMAIPGNQLTSSYWFPSYSYPDAGTWSQLRIANPSSTQSTTVQVYLAGSLLGTYSLAPFGSTRVDYLGQDGGPLEVTSTDASPILTAVRVIQSVSGIQTSYAEITGFPGDKLTTSYLFPWYNDFNFDSQIRMAVP